MRRAASMTGSAFRGNEVQRACDPVPGVDGRYGDSKRIDFGVGKLRSDSVSHLSRCAMRRCFGQSLGPFQSKTFARSKQGGVPPDRKLVQLALTATLLPSQIDVELRAIGAAVHL